MTANAPNREPGYRGALPPRNDTLARPWILIVAAALLLMFVLSALSIPSRFVVQPSPSPTAVPTAPATATPSAPATATPTAAATATPAPSGSP